MKKFAITLCILGGLGLTSAALASIQAEDTATVPHLKSQGFSSAMTHVTDTVNYLHSYGEAETYYNLDPLADTKDEKNKWYTVVKRWFDPAQDDMMFGRHDINFTNSWFEEGSPFAYQKAKKEEVTAEDTPEDINVQDAAPVEEIENL